jgi:hypothetical protein
MLEANESLAIQIERHQALVSAIEHGILSEEIFTRTIKRLNQLRSRFRLTHTVPELTDVDPARRDRAEDIARHSIVSLGQSPFMPLSSTDTGLIVNFHRLRGSEAEDPVHREDILRELTTQNLPNMHLALLEHVPTPHAVQSAIDRASSAPTLIFLTRDATDNPVQIEIAHQVIAAAPDDVRIIHIALRGPYDIGLIPEAQDRLATYGDPAVTLRALFDILTGLASITGTSPITL